MPFPCQKFRCIFLLDLHEHSDSLVSRLHVVLLCSVQELRVDLLEEVLYSTVTDHGNPLVEELGTGVTFNLYPVEKVLVHRYIWISHNLVGEKHA